MLYLPIDKLLNPIEKKADASTTAQQETVSVPLRAPATTNKSAAEQDIYPQEGY
jgi:hypothetical protein